MKQKLRICIGRPAKRGTTTCSGFILVVLLLLLPGYSVYSQRFNGGILAGGIVSQVDGDNWIGYHKFGFMVGGMVSLQVSPHSTFQMEMEFIQKGSRKNSDLEAGDPTVYLMRLNYLEVPLLYQYTFLKRFSVEAGPAMDVLLGYKESLDGQEVPEKYPFRHVTLAGIVGVAGYITHHLKATFRFNYSLLSIRVPQENPPSVWRKILFEAGQYNNVMSLSLSWDFKYREF